MKKFTTLRSTSLTLFALLMSSALVNAQHSYATLAATYSQNFNNLISTGNQTVTGGNLNNMNTNLNGWYFLESGTNANTNIIIGNGSGTGGDTYSIGATSNSERALGGLLSGSLVPTIGFYLTNNTGSTITSADISYTGETWRVGAATRSDRLDFQYSTNASSLSSGTWIDVNALDYANPGQATANGSMLHSASISSTITGLTLTSGNSIFIRWVDFNATGSDDLMGVDDFSFVGNGAGGGSTSVQFASTGSTVSEGVGTVDLTLEITDEDATVDTEVDVVITVGAPGRVNSYTTQTVTFTGGSSADETLTITVSDNSLCDGDASITFELQNITGGQGTAAVGANDQYDLEITDNDLCTSVEFVSATSSGAEGGGTVALTLAITNPSGSLATTVDVALTSGSAADVNSYTTQTVTFPAGSSADQTVTITITDDALCEGPESLTFTVQNIAGGQGTAYIGAQSANVLTITDNDAFAATIQDDFEDGNFFGWVENAAGRWSASSVNPMNGNYSLREVDQNVAGSSYISKAMGGVDLSTGAASWQWQNGYNNDPSTSNKFWFWIVANEANVASNTVDGYAVGVNLVGSTDLVTLWRVDNGITGTRTPIITSTYDWNTGETGFRVTRTAAGGWELFLDTDGGFNALVSAGTGTDATYTTVDYVAQYAAYSASLGGLLKFDDFAFTAVSCGNTYYSQATGNVYDAIWSTAMVGTPSAVNFTIGDNMVVQNTHVVTMNNDTYTRNLTVDAGGELIIEDGIVMHVSGDEVIFDGGLTANEGSTLSLESGLAAILESAGGPLNVFDLRVNTPNGILTDATITVVGTLLLQDGDFDITTGSLTLMSDANGTGRLGPVGSGATYSGDLTMQRYIPAGATNWRLMGSPVAGQTVNEWKDDFITAGFPGSNSPNFDNPVGSGILWPSVRWYDETLNNSAIDTGWVGVPNITQSLVQGQGFAAWCGTGLENTTAFTVDMTGAPYVANTPIDVPLSYTDNGLPLVDGYNAASNPLASPILFSRIARTSVNDYIWYYNPADGNTAVYDISLGNGTNGGTDTIQSSQAFLVKATAGGAQLQFEEADKVEDRVGGFFGGSQVSTFNGIRLNVSSAINTFRDETLVVFGAGAAGRDSEDVEKFTFSHPGAPQIATRTPDGGVIAINAFGAYTTDISIPVMVDVAISGTYTITASGTENIGLSCLVLEDMTTGTMTPMIEGATYSFSMEATDDANAERFVLHASAPVSFNTVAATCNGVANGAGTVVYVGTEPMDITWTNAAGLVLDEQTITEGSATLNGLEAGEYTVEVSSTSACGALSTSFRIEEPAAMEIDAIVIDANCPNENGSATVTVLGGVAPFTYLWSNGTTGAELNAAPGELTVTVTDANGCVADPVGIVIEAGVGPEAMATANATIVLVNTEVSFTNNSVAADEYAWDFDDGSTSTEMEPAHAWSIPGTYTVVLTVNDGNCSDTWTTDITVETISNIADVATATTLSAWYANDKFVLEHSFNNGKPVTIDIMDATGRLHATRQVAGSPARVSIPSEGLNTGIWFVRVTNAQEQRTFRVPLVR